MSLLRRLNHLRKDFIKMIGSKPQGAAEKERATRKTFRTFEVQRIQPSATRAHDLLHPTRMSVRDVISETSDAIRIVLARPDGKPITFTPGMFFTVLVNIGGQEHRRAYSIASPVQQPDQVEIVVKRIADGLVSGWLKENLRAGDSLEVLGPSGTFTLIPNAERIRHLLMVGGGSGITPLMSILQSVLIGEPGSRVVLLYGNRALEDIIFKNTIDHLVKSHGDRLTVRYVLESPKKNWKGGRGRLDRQTFSRELDSVLETMPIESIELYQCGPELMMAGVQEEMLSRGLPLERLHKEQFSPAAKNVESTSYSVQLFDLRHNDRIWKGTVQPGETLLEAGLAVGAPMTFSCTLGGCGRCRVKLLDGQVEMPEPNCLLPSERESRYALSCISRPLTPVIFELDPPSA